MNANKREYFICAATANYILFNDFAFICVHSRSFAEKMLFAFKKNYSANAGLDPATP